MKNAFKTCRKRFTAFVRLRWIDYTNFLNDELYKHGPLGLILRNTYRPAIERQLAHESPIFSAIRENLGEGTVTLHISKTVERESSGE